MWRALGARRAAVHPGGVRALCARGGVRALHACKLPSRAVYEFKGPEVFKFLQGSITQNIQSLEKCVTTHSFAQGQDAFYAAFLNPQGRVMADAFFHVIPHASEPGVLVELDATTAADLIQFVRRFKLRTKFQISDVSEGWDVWQVWGDATPEMPAADGAVRVYRDIRAPHIGWRILVPKNEQLPIQAEDVGSMSYTVHRMLQGVPEGAHEIHMGLALPLESCIDYMHGIDFRKGCYIGQELTARTFFTGLVRKRIMPVRFSLSPPDPAQPLAVDLNAHVPIPAADTDVRLKAHEAPDASARPARARSAGKVLSGVHDIGLAMLRFEHVERAHSDAPDHPHLVCEAPDGSLVYLHAYRPAWWPEPEEKGA